MAIFLIEEGHTFLGEVPKNFGPMRDGLVKSHKSDGTVKSSRRKARESLGMRRTYQYAAVTKDEAQRRRWIFYEAVSNVADYLRLP